jgi:hypothetical protein
VKKSGKLEKVRVHWDAFGLDERTVASWRDREGTHSVQVHQALVEVGKLDLVHVQAVHP